MITTSALKRAKGNEDYMSHSIEELKKGRATLQREIARLLYNFEKKYQVRTGQIVTIVKNRSKIPAFASVCDVEVELKI